MTYCEMYEKLEQVRRELAEYYRQQEYIREPMSPVDKVEVTFYGVTPEGKMKYRVDYINTDLPGRRPCQRFEHSDKEIDSLIEIKRWRESH